MPLRDLLSDGDREALAEAAGVLEGSGECVAAIGEDLRCVRVTGAYAGLFGRKADAMIGTDPDAELVEEDRPRLEHALMRLAQSSRAELTVRYRGRADGELLVRLVLVPRTRGGHFRFARDVTASVRAERERDRFFDLSVDLLCEASADGYFKRLSRSWERALGWSVDQLMTMPFIEFVHPDDRERTITAMSRLRTGETVLEFDNRYRHRDGGWRYLVWSSVMDPELTTVYAVARDVTGSRLLHRALQESEEKYRGLYQSIVDGVALIGADDRISECNDAFAAIAGAPIADLRGSPIAALLAPQRQVALRDVMALSGPAPREVETEFVRGGTTVPVALRAWRAGHGAGVWLLAHDLGERRRVERERQRLELHLRQSQKLEAIGQLAAGIAHEINTPLQYVGDNARFLQESLASLLELLDGALPLARAAASDAAAAALAELEQRCDLEYLRREMPSALAQALEGIGRVSDIVRALKMLSHPGGDEPVPTDLNALVENAVLVSRNEWKYVAELDCVLDRSLSSVPCLPGMISQVLLNLIVNAAYAIGEATRGDAKGRLTVRTRRDGEWAELRIGDTGRGIPAEVRHRLFEPFFTTKPVGKGTGQGLAIARAIVVEKHQGTIAFESEVGKGTEFIVRLPLTVRA